MLEYWVVTIVDIIVIVIVIIVAAITRVRVMNARLEMELLNQTGGTEGQER